jgi:predicted ATPase with chaperone activity
LVDVRRPQENCAVSVLRIGRQFVSFRPGIGKSLLAGRRRVPFPSMSKPKRLVAQRIWAIHRPDGTDFSNLFGRPPTASSRSNEFITAVKETRRPKNAG